jgi:hypothetical protein
MAYEKLNLKNGDTLTEAHLQHLEEGIANAGKGSDLLDENGILKQEYFPEGFPYKSGEDVEILPGTTLTADPESGAFAIPEVVNTSELFDGMRCVVTFEGIGAYETICRGFPPENEMGLQFALGNMAYLGLGDDTGEPFALGIMLPEMAAEMGFAGVMSAPLLAAESLTVSISGFKGTFATIDPGYIEHGTVLVRVIGDISSGDFTASHTGKEIDKLLNDGKVVVLEHMKSADSILRTVYTLSSRQKGVAVEFRNMDVFTDHIEVNDINVSVYDNAWYRTGVRAQATVL